MNIKGRLESVITCFVLLPPQTMFGECFRQENGHFEIDTFCQEMGECGFTGGRCACDTDRRPGCGVALQC